MARFRQLAWGELAGKIGDIVICKGKTGWYARRKTTKNRKPPTPSQQALHRRLAATVLFYRAIKEADLYKIWQVAASETKMTGFNLFIKTNIHNFSNTGTILDFDKIQLSAGQLRLPVMLRICNRDMKSICLEWDEDIYLSTSHPQDRPIAILMKNKDSYTVTLPETDRTCRKDGRMTIRLPPDAEEYHHLYVFFEAETNDKFSETKYFEI